ncbi:short-chain fatty acyl-CoA regulator family protein [Corynebacterium halotolerans]|uniref:HTH-type transcriptional regulator n=1 Tax=Corynebacterium halotolerans YIM 70093 = DSM 44683 TaxID=1121362 RepID=M1NJT8_9CORY|nr:short-chain fatty acyl-CoA regulator family protein [Corynebacterium halotolerans]AGF71663.1 HTH-type transcriptional regulator [Corynebacterium halotolerans YIM 70093 = DSM 44683]
MTKHFAGGRIRTLRRTRSLTQVEMARRLDLSTSYLNQLENDQRPLTVTVLMALSSAFDVDPAFFSPEHDARTVGELRDVFPDAPVDQLADLAARHPDLVPGVLDLAHRSPAPAEISPYELVRDYFYDAHNYIDELDTLGEELAGRLGEPQLRLTRLATVLDRELGVTVRFRKLTSGPRRIFHPGGRELHLRTGLSEAQLCFELALQYALLALPDLLDELSASLPTEESRAIARLALAQYFAAAVTMPYEIMLTTAEDTRYDIDRIADHFGTGFETTCHRLSTLQRPGARGVPFFFVRTDRAGNISKRQSATSFHFSRSGGSCPLWVIHRAFETRGRITRQVAGMPDGRHYLWIARTVHGQSRGFGTPNKEFAVALGCDLEQAERLVYSSGLDLSPASATPIGPGCRACPRERCPQRAFPQAGRRTVVDLDATVDESYATVTPDPRGA